MIFSRSTRYAIQALVLLAGLPAGHYMRCRTLADRLGLPEAYLGKLMLRFTQAGLLDSSRGRAGGYRLRQSAHDISLLRVAEVVSAGRVSRECLLGLKNCSDDAACAMHCRWQPVKTHLFGMLEEQTLKQLSLGVASGRYRLTELNLERLAAELES